MSSHWERAGEFLPKVWPMWGGLTLGLATAILGLTSSPDHTFAWQLAARFTARAGFPLLILAYVARPLYQLLKTNWSKRVLQKRKWIGLGFAMCHTVHLVALYMAIELSGQPWEAVTLIFGGGAYLTMYAMAFTSNARAMKALGKWWKRLHTFGIHYLWFIFIFTYAGRLSDPETVTTGVVGVSLATLAAAIRFAAWLKFRAKK